MRRSMRKSSCIATPEELASLRAQIASRETFSRYGLDYPAFLTGIQVQAGAAGRWPRRHPAHLHACR